MKITTILGTRPEIIRLSQVIKVLDTLCEHRVVHTGQNYDPQLSDVFFEDLALRKPDAHLGVSSSRFGDQVGQILSRVADEFESSRPDRLLVLGDTNSGLAAIVAARGGIPVFHMEAGNRCFDDRVPEEINRRVIDHSSTILMPYTARSMENLVAEGIERERIFVTGNPIYEVITTHRAAIDASAVLTELRLAPRQFFLATLHRAENVDDQARLNRFVLAFERLATAHGVPVIVSTHPRTAERLSAAGVQRAADGVRFVKPLRFFDFIHLEQRAAAVLSDSGTVQEECAIFGVPNVTLRDVTERPETIECGSNMLTGSDPESIVSAVDAVCRLSTGWTPPDGYMAIGVARTVAKILLGYTGVRRYV